MSHDRLQIAEDIGYQRRQWIFERIGTVALAVLLLAALLGLFGPGLLGPARVRTRDGALTVEYPPFARACSSMILRVTIRPTAESVEGNVRLWIASSYLAGVTLEHVTPDPRSVELGDGRITFAFDRDRSAAQVEAWLDVKARRFGSLGGEIGLADGETLHVSHFVYP